jgi:hypothetical protein
MDDKAHYPVETFDPLLRDLVVWGLVERVEDEDGDPTWRLSDDARRRIDELVPAQTRPVPDRLVYFDHLCARCHRREPTRLHSGAYLCASCLELERVEAARVDLPEVERSRRRVSLRRRRGAVEETGPLAS